MEDPSYICCTCGKQHAEIPLSFAADFPDPYANLSREDRDNRALISSDQCIIDQEQFYLRGCLELSIVGSDDSSGEFGPESTKKTLIRLMNSGRKTAEKTKSDPSKGDLLTHFQFIQRR